MILRGKATNYAPLKPDLARGVSTCIVDGVLGLALLRGPQVEPPAAGEVASHRALARRQHGHHHQVRPEHKLADAQGAPAAMSRGRLAVGQQHVSAAAVAAAWAAATK